jgi:hypothetical protein
MRVMVPDEVALIKLNQNAPLVMVLSRGFEVPIMTMFQLTIACHAKGMENWFSLTILSLP